MNEYKDRKVGVAHYGEDRLIFTPDEAAVGSIQSASGVYKVNLLSDGSWEGRAVPPRVRHRPKLVCKLAHGRISHTNDGAYLMTIKIFEEENIDIHDAIVKEAAEAAGSIINYNP